jgi:hypothetical protein
MEEKTDRHLQAPQEANRDKHINTAIEQGDEDPSLADDENLTQSRFKEKAVEQKEKKNVEQTARGNAGIGSDDEAH